jgi:hydrogenase-1 operon protein HyaE
MANVIDKVVASGAMDPLSVETLPAFLADGRPAVQLLAFLGDTQSRPEAQDVVVVLRELKRGYGEQLRIGLIDQADTLTLMDRFQVRQLPSVAVLTDGQVRDVIPRIQDWAVYAAKVKAWAKPQESRP